MVDAMHMVHRMAALLLCPLCLCGCARPMPLTGTQPLSVIWPEPAPPQPEMLPPPTQPEVLPEVHTAAVWIPMMVLSDWMDGGEAAFRERAVRALEDCVSLGIGTVYLHVRAYCDAYYDSALFPLAGDGSFDPLAIVLEGAHARGIAVHAWINPLRGDTAKRTASLPEASLLRQWYDDPGSGCLAVVDGRCYLDPSQPAVRQLICDGAEEIFEHYDVDGLHIDDYFYPTTDPSFDAGNFATSGQTDLGAFRRESCTQLIRQLHDTAAAHSVPFSISPQGNLQTDYDTLYADVWTWCREGLCEQIVPQLYYGFDNDTCPFSETLHKWEEAAGDTPLLIGLAAYKYWQEDPWAGSGVHEWIDDPQVLTRQLELVLASDAADGVAFYSYASLGLLPDEERQKIAAMLGA